MVTTLIVNASPLISLGKAGLLGLLEYPVFEVRIPAPVADEVLIQHDDGASLWLKSEGRARIVVCPPTVDPILMAWDLGRGETSVISCAGEAHQAIVVLDDLAARRCAQAFGLRCTGTLGLLFMAKQRGLLPAVVPAINRLRESGLYIGDSVVDTIRKIAGE